jgi:hypothetical protein
MRRDLQDPSKRSLAEKILRAVSGLGEEVKRRLGERIGAHRAHSLRARKDGCEGSRTSSAGTPR